jgi:Flp pilus assembly protein TadD
MRRNIFICLLLAGVTLAIYWPVRHYGIVYFDDPLFMTKNQEINSGLTWHSFWWALSGILVANWHPVTSLSFVLGHQLWGTNPGAEHVVNAVFHAANAVLLFLVLHRMTKSPWCCLVVAALFAWHPLRVESVAWISERKDVLCGFFFMLTLWAYARFVEEFKVQGSKSKVFFVLSLLAFALGLMSKAMLVSVPFLLLLLDLWPLQRIEIQAGNLFSSEGVRQFLPQLKGLAREKWPFFALSVFFSGLTFYIQKSSAAVVSWDILGWGDRISNAVSSYLLYLAKLFWPAKLAAIYPYAKSLDVTEVWLAGLLFLAVSALCLRQISRRPYLAVGWFWYLAAAFPIIGLVQVGGQAMADRYTYIPLIGPVISLVWLAADRPKTNLPRKFLLAAAAIILPAVCVILARRQVQLWENTISLFEHAIEVTAGNSAAQFSLGAGLEHEGRLSESMVHYRIAIKLEPRKKEAYYAMGGVLIKQKKWSEAASIFNIVLEFDPSDLVSHIGLAAILPHLHQTKETILHLEMALQIDPESPEVLNDLAWTLATSPEADIRDGARAVQLAERACQLANFRQTLFVGTLAAAYAEAGRFDEAMATAQKACALASQSGEQELLKKNQELLELYRGHKPCHEAAEKLVPAAP